MKNGSFLTSIESSDGFVGIRFVEDLPEVVFPHGFNIAEDEKEKRRDAISLISVLQRFSEHTEGNISHSSKNNISEIPISSYQYVIYDFISHGYYKEKETRYLTGHKGKIDWRRTIQKEKAQIDNGNVVYLKYQVKENKIRNDNLMTEIHKYCVHCSMMKFGWLFLSSGYIPPKPQQKANMKLYLTTLRNALNNTFNDNKKRLFQSMINILSYEQDLTDERPSAGVYKFEKVWENIVDYVFGEENKQKYFPKATWTIIKDTSVSKSSSLEPDTIMIFGDKYYVLDAKYYKYGITLDTEDLPKTSSIQKQITYGKYVAKHFSKNENEVYNAFIMPFNSYNTDKYKFVSIGTADWEKYNAGTPNYAYILGILVDTKWIIKKYVKHNNSEIERLANLIEESLESSRALI